ncbi:MAG: hypothetical protein J6J44_14350 [Lachnospiraceae bacterium]|nr:hypothetical protein [Lachnospiraceae bacterium]
MKKHVKSILQKVLTAMLCSAFLLPVLPSTDIHTASAETVAANAIYVAPNATGTGSESSPMALEEAITTVAAGQTIYLLEGTYQFNDTILIAENNCGTEGQYKTLSAYPGAEVVLDFAGQSFGKRGIILDGDYWHLYGITICNAGDNGMLLAGNYNIIELCIFDGNKDTGLQLSRNNGSYNKVEQWPSYNYILNCTSRNNSDPDGEDADGFAPKLTCGEGNVFDGCLAYNNVDDGWDCYAKSATGPIGVVTLINCIAFRNGQTEEGVYTPDSDGNGFKLGGGGIGTPHVVINCLAFENKNCGFTDNNNPSALTMINCTAFNNNGSQKKADFNVYRCKNANAANILAYNAVKNKNKFQNMSANYVVYPADKDWYQVTSYGPFDTQNSTAKGTKTNNGLTAADFLVTQSPALGTDFHTLWRESDGSIDTLGYAMLTSGSSYASFSTDGGACGARFGKGAEFVTPDNVLALKAAAIGGNTPAATVAPTATPAPTATVAPAATPAPVVTAAPTATPVPTVTVAPTETPAPTATVAPTATPVPTATETPAPTVAPAAPADSGNSVLLICCVASVAIIAVAAIAIVVIFKNAK